MHIYGASPMCKQLCTVLLKYDDNTWSSLLFLYLQNSFIFDLHSMLLDSQVRGILTTFGKILETLSGHMSQQFYS